jgi:hypothetical protein
MVKKKFIDKKQSTTYSLVFRSTEDADDLPERVLVEADQSAGAGRADAGGTSSAADEEASGRRYPPGHPLSWLEEEERGAPMSEARRRELIELGFPGEAGAACAVVARERGSGGSTWCACRSSPALSSVRKPCQAVPSIPCQQRVNWSALLLLRHRLTSRLARPLPSSCRQMTATTT